MSNIHWHNHSNQYNGAPNRRCHQKMKPFGLFLRLKELNRLHEFPKNQRAEIIRDLDRLISELQKLIDDDKCSLPAEHLVLERDKYKKELNYIIMTERWQREG